jgi:co-chaperonin GroES (HSP10)
MKPIKDKILVKELDSAVYKQKIGDLVLDIDPGGKEYVTAEVISFGSDVKELKVGDKVFIYPNSGKTIRDPETNEEMRVITTLEIIVVL